MHWSAYFRWLVWSATVAAVIVVTVFLINYVQPRRNVIHGPSLVKNGAGVSTTPNDDEDPPPPIEPISVKIVHPVRGAMERITVQVGSIQAYQTVSMYAKASGFLKTQNVDIGDRVKRGQILADVDVPELEKQIQRNAAAVEQAKARVPLMETKITIAEADVEAAKAKAEEIAKTPPPDEVSLG